MSRHNKGANTTCCLDKMEDLSGRCDIKFLNHYLEEEIYMEQRVLKGSWCKD